MGDQPEACWPAIFKDQADIGELKIRSAVRPRFPPGFRQRNADCSFHSIPFFRPSTPARRIRLCVPHTLGRGEKSFPSRHDVAFLDKMPGGAKAMKRDIRIYRSYIVSRFASSCEKSLFRNPVSV
jgi:hypothetical protein